jgi:hypothetical protein
MKNISNDENIPKTLVFSKNKLLVKILNHIEINKIYFHKKSNKIMMIIIIIIIVVVILIIMRI